MKQTMCKALAVISFVGLLSGCGSFSAAETALVRNDSTASDIARCGAGLGIDNKLGLIFKTEAQKKGGEYSAALSSEIRAKVASEGLTTGDEKKYDAYLKCILELDKRRADQLKSAQAERLQQPTLKVYRSAPELQSEDRFARRIVVENTGEELTELQVTPAPFLYIGELCMVRAPTDCRPDAIDKRSLKSAYIPIDNYYSGVSIRGSYKGELYSQDERGPSRLSDTARMFTRAAWDGRGQSMTDYVVTLVRVRYKDKFQIFHERFIDVTIEQKEMPRELGERVFALRRIAFAENRTIDGSAPTVERLQNLWASESRVSSDVPEPWRLYKITR